MTKVEIFAQTQFVSNDDVLRLGIVPHDDQISFTGERVVPGAVEDQLWNEHTSRYRFASLFAAGGHVLDVGCGTGYGTEMMAQSAAHAVGFDHSAASIRYAQKRFSHADFMCGSATAFPFDSSSFHLITAFEVIEHLADWSSLLRESLRVLAPDGVFLVSTPNTEYYAEARGSSGPNPYHVHEFAFQDFQQSLKDVFPCVQILAQNQQETITFSGDWSGEQGAVFIPPNSDLTDAHFFLAVCSLKPVRIPFFADISSTHNLLREREKHLWGVLGELDEMRSQHAKLAELQCITEQRLQSINRELEAATQENLLLKNALEIDVRAFDTLLAEHQAVRNSGWIRLGRMLGLGPWSRRKKRLRLSIQRDKTRLNAAAH